MKADDQDESVDYTVGAEATGTVEVVDDDSLPIITIMTENGEVAENEGPAQFTLMATRVIN